MFNKNFSHELKEIVDLFLELQQVKERRRTCRDLKIVPKNKEKSKKIVLVSFIQTVLLLLCLTRSLSIGTYM